MLMWTRKGVNNGNKYHIKIFSYSCITYINIKKKDEKRFL